MVAAEIVRIIAREFEIVSDDEINKFIELAAPFVSKKAFGKQYETALAYMACHKMKMAGIGEFPEGDPGTLWAGFMVSSISTDARTINFGTKNTLNSDAELGLTVYGTQFLQLRRMCVPTIICG